MFSRKVIIFYKNPEVEATRHWIIENDDLEHSLAVLRAKGLIVISYQFLEDD